MNRGAGAVPTLPETAAAMRTATDVTAAVLTPTVTENVVGDRVLVAVQAINISRLSTHPVPTVPGTLIVVAGAGPKDSNGAGKSSFIAAITALLGDEQWRFASGAKAVSELLFNAELAAQGDQQWASADHGYIIGVFDVPSAGLPITVWVRVNQEAPHLEVRWAEGVRLSRAASEADRVSRADELWAELPKSAGRRDVVARDLTRVLYGDRVRCVSFLSTSVRSKVATNLLSQPLNEISPERIFEAIAALTGLDGELDQEREARRDEHAKRVRAAQAEERLREFERDSAALLGTFDRRDQARARLAEALRCWRGRIARRFVDAADRDQELKTDLTAHEDAADTTSEAIAAVKTEISGLKDDSLDRALAAARRELATIQVRANKLETERAVIQNTADELRARIPALEDLQRQSDGLDVPTANTELADARHRLNEALKAQGVADREAQTAETALQEAENGPASAQLRALSAAGLPAASLLDALDVAEHAHDTLPTPGGWPHDLAVIVDSGHMRAAAQALADLPGSVLVSPAGVTVIGAFEDAVTGRDARIKAAEQRLTRARDTQQRALHAVRQAEEGVAAAKRRVEGAEATIRLAEIHRRLTDQRDQLGILQAAITELTPTLDTAEQEVSTLDFRARTRNMEIERLDARRQRLESERDQARLRATEIATERHALDLPALSQEWASNWPPPPTPQPRTATGSTPRTPESARTPETARTPEKNGTPGERVGQPLSGDLPSGAADGQEAARAPGTDGISMAARTSESGGTPETAPTPKAARIPETDGISKAARISESGGTPETARTPKAARTSGASGRPEMVRELEAARDWLTAADPLTADEWWRTAERHLDAALRATFAETDETPEELDFLIKERRSGRSAQELATFPALCASLASYLRGQEEYERHQRRQIESQVTSRRRDLSAATKGAEEAAQSTAVHRAALTEAIRTRLARVAEEFGKLDTGYGGYGATLDFPVPTAPADPEQRWSWRVIPKWRRGEGQSYVPYNRRANTALMDEKAVKLVCAAAIASSGGTHLTLVLDELGRNLGKEHRREAVSLFRRIGETHGITVIGALQDDMEPYAIDACGQYIKLRRSSDTTPYNDPPIIIAHDRHPERVHTLSPWITR
ncbi:chromosome partitioning protein ParA [Acrocarpospora macrocephala]|uniref:chromosome partitioning protein ParA n=1 Tax=Acrocarpospora macrocephala TaxID=150177 RepID=UPI001FED0F12|nr:chromosome partitioning protein ParA [Acrocarpospora macrocephala]